MDDNDLFQNARFPTPTRPLLGLTILVVEDSRFAGEAMRLLCLRSGARIRRADSLASADRHLSVYQPSVIVVDLGLPDGDGLQLIRLLSGMSPRIGIIIGTSGDDAAGAVVKAAGADGFLAKPIANLATFQELVLSCIPEDRRPMGPRMINDDQILPNVSAYKEDLSHAADLLSDEPEEKVLDYVAQFLTGAARCAGDLALVSASEALGIARMQQRACRSQVADLAGLLQERLRDQDSLQRRI